MKELPDLNNVKISFNATAGLKSNTKIPTHYQTTLPDGRGAKKLNFSSIQTKNSLNDTVMGLHDESITHH